MATVFTQDNKIINSLISVIISGIIILMAGESRAADSHDDYRSIYTLGWEVAYRDNENVYKTEYRYSFKDLYNLKDTKVLCHNEFDDCDLPESVLLELKDPKGGTFSQSQFRIYVPPGTHRVDCIFFCRASDIVGVAARYGSPIEGDYSNLDVEDYDYNIDWKSPTDYNTLADYTGKDVLRRNARGAISILSGPIGGVTEKGGWFYFKLLSFKRGTKLYDISYANGVYTEKYGKWYEGVAWDNNDDPSENYVAPQPKQQVLISADPANPVKADPDVPETNGNFEVALNYNVTNPTNGYKELDGLNLEIHYDSSKLKFIDNYDNLFVTGNTQAPKAVDTGNSPADKMVKVEWTGNGDWPGANEILPLHLVDLNFKLLEYGATLDAKIVNNVTGYGKIHDHLIFTDPSGSTGGSGDDNNNSGSTGDSADPEADRWNDNPGSTIPTYPDTSTDTTGSGSGSYVNIGGRQVWVPGNSSDGGSGDGGSDDGGSDDGGSDDGGSDDGGSDDGGSGSGSYVNIGGRQVWVPGNSGDGGSDDGGSDDGGSDDGGSDDGGTDSGDTTDPEAARFDSDNDGYTPEQGDLDDNDGTIHPNAEEICDGKDNDQDGVIDEDCPTCTDADGDGYYAENGCGTAVDCDDHDPTINPGLTVDCGSDSFFGDGKDNDCDGDIDEDCKSDDGDDTGNDDDVNNGDSNGMNTPPEAPLLLSPDGSIPVSLAPKLELQENAFTDLDGDAHVKTQWLIGKDKWDESLIVVDTETDTQLTAWRVPSMCILEKGKFYYWRASVYDGQAWSPVSEYLGFWTSDRVEFDENGIGLESVIEPGETVMLGSEFVDGYGNLLLSDTRKAMKSVVAPDIQIGMTVDSGCTINKICSRRPDDFIDQEADFVTAQDTEPGTEKIPDMPYGVIDFAVTVPEKGGSATVEFTFSEPLPENFRWWKYDPKEGGFYDFMNRQLLVSAAGIIFSSDRKKLTLTLTDGGPGDMIEQQDGKIIDPSGFGPTSTAASEDVSPSSSSGGGGGCFIQSLML